MASPGMIEYKEREKLARSCLAYCVWDIHVYNALFFQLQGSESWWMGMTYTIWRGMIVRY